MSKRLYLMKVYHQGEFCCLDHDDLLWSGCDEAERDKFIEEWVERRAYSYGACKGDPNWETACAMARSQLSYSTEEPEIVKSGEKILESISVESTVDSVLKAINDLKEIAAEKYDEENLRIEIYETRSDYKVRKVTLSCRFQLHADGSEDCFDYCIDLCGHQ